MKTLVLVTILLFGTNLNVVTMSALKKEAECETGEISSAKDIEKAAVNAVRALEGYSDFSIDLFKDILNESGNDSEQNIFISPLSVWSALTATYLGSNGETAVELRRSLGLDKMSRADIAQAYKMLKAWYYMRTDENSSANYTFRMANKLFFQKGEPISDCIQKLLNSEIMNVDFASKPEAARTLINNWVKQQTGGKIEEIVSAGLVDTATRMILVNAAYFKGTWLKEFPQELTNNLPFFVHPHESITVPTMIKEDLLRMSRSNVSNCSMIEIPYSGGEISMFILLPTRGTSVENMMSKLSAKAIRDFLLNNSPKTVSLTLPRFNIEQTSELGDSLRRLGIRDLFDPVRADLSGFTGTNDFSVSRVNHKVFVKVNEQGTEAAAATGLISLRSGLLPSEFHVDRPFVFLIRDNVLDATLFMGLIRKPQE
ncbi:hypothetical protein CHUAL_004219 [Chamberlinius hualienensis]